MPDDGRAVISERNTGLTRRRHHAGMSDIVPAPKPIPHIDLASEPVSFPVRRYRPAGADDVVVEFGEISVAELTAHPIFVAAAMTKITRRRILEHVGTVREIRADLAVVGLHIVFRPGPHGAETYVAMAKVKIALPCRALSLFETGEYRLDMDASRERALIRMLEVLGIPEAPEDRDLDAEASAATLAP